jgi:hypothetical protein
MRMSRKGWSCAAAGCVSDQLRPSGTLPAFRYAPCLRICWVGEEEWPGQCPSVAVCQVHAAVQVRQQAVTHAVRLARRRSNIRPPAAHSSMQAAVHLRDLAILIEVPSATSLKLALHGSW